MTDYTIVEPSFEFWGACTPNNYMEILERATRTCYKSEEHIKEGSAEKLMSKVVNKFGHHSVIEHASAIIEISFDSSLELSNFVMEVIGIDDVKEKVPLFAHRMSTRTGNILIMSGNFRMWKRLLRLGPEARDMVFPYNAIRFCLGQNLPFFFDSFEGFSNPKVRLLDSDPSTNRSFLSTTEMMRHMTLTGKFIGSRAMSHQLVRHRMAAYSQESQRYCNYGKKGFQFIVPPSYSKEIPKEELEFRATFPGEVRLLSPYEDFVDSCALAFDEYLRFLNENIPPEDARHLLPNACKTEVVATYTLAMWKHVIEHRGHNPKAQWEIRDLCLQAEKDINMFIGWRICGE